MKKALAFDEFMGLSIKTFEKFSSKSPSESIKRTIIFWSSIAVLLVSWFTVRTFATDNNVPGFTFLSVIHDLTGYVVQGSFIIKGFSLLYLHHSSILQCFEQLHDLFPKTVKEQEKFRVDTHWKAVHFKNKCFLNFYIWNTAMFTLLPLIVTVYRKFFGDGVYEMVLAVQFRIDIDLDQIFVREICAIFVIINNIITFAFSISFDTLYVSILSGLCMQFKILNQKIQELDFKNPIAKEKFKSLVDDHQRLIELSDLVKKIFSTTLLTNFTCGTMTVCFLGFEILASILFF